MIETLALVVVVGLAGYRLARAVARDDITEPFRKAVYRWTYEGLKDPLKIPQKSHVFVFNLVTCPVCVGFWITLVIGLVASAQLTDAPLLQHLLVAVAAAGVQASLSLRETGPG